MKNVLGKLKKLWMAFSHRVGAFNSAVILSLFYFLIFTPVALIRRAFAGSEMKLGFDKTQKSYREPSKPTKPLHRPF